MSVHGRFEKDESEVVRREELSFTGEYDGFDPEFRAHQLGKVAWHAVLLWANNKGVAFDARLVASELLANTHRHGMGPSAMTIANIRKDDDQYFEISVANAVSSQSPSEAHVREIDDADAEDGRGIRIIEALSQGDWQ